MLLRPETAAGTLAYCQAFRISGAALCPAPPCGAMPCRAGASPQVYAPRRPAPRHIAHRFPAPPRPRPRLLLLALPPDAAQTLYELAVGVGLPCTGAGARAPLSFPLAAHSSVQ